MNHISNAEGALRNFVESNFSRVFLLKGKYGTGKSHFLRQFLMAHQRALPLFVSYTSCFGLHDLKELASVASGSLKARQIKRFTYGNASQFARYVLSCIPITKNLQLPPLTWIWKIANSCGLLLIIDDIDRKGTNLALEDILGFASSLTEHSTSRTKVILVINEEALAQTENCILAKLREKLIDVEFQFSPSATELAQEFVRNKSIRNAIEKIHEIAHSPNIRTMLKIENMLDDFESSITPLNLSNGNREHFVILAFIYLSFGELMTDPRFVNSLKERWRRVFVGDTDSENTKEVYRLMGESGFEFDKHFDLLLLHFFSHGYINQELLAAFKQEHLKKGQQTEFQKDWRNLWSIFNSNFRNSESDFKSAATSFISKHNSLIGASDLNKIAGYLSQLGIETDPLWNNWLDANLDEIPHDELDDLQAILPPELAPRLEALKQSKLIHVTFDTLLVNERPNSAHAALFASWTPEQFVKWFDTQDDNESLLVELRSFMGSNYSDPAYRTISNSLRSALRLKAAEGKFNKLRVNAMFGQILNSPE